MPSLTIDNQTIEVAEGTTILDAARALGIDIPTLCYLPGKPAQTSCFLCVVRVQGLVRLVPACATVATDGMVVESETEEVRGARRTAIELMLSDHLGDCIGPCQGVCPAHLNTPLMMRQIAAGKFREALITVKDSIALPAVLGRVCPELCEKGCKRAASDGAVSVCMLKRYVADVDLETGNPYLPPCEPPSGKRVAIIGAGPAGLAAAYYLLQYGHACTLFDDHEEPGGNLRYAVPEDELPREVLDGEIGIVSQMGAEFRMGTRVGRDLSLDDLSADYDAVLIAVGEVRPESAPAAGLEFARQGLKADRATMGTNLPAVFVAGSAIIPSHHAVRAVADGKAAAQSIDQFLRGGGAGRDDREWSVHTGKLEAADLQPLIRLASPAGRIAPTGGKAEGFTEEEARREASRCLRCDCGKAETCKLRSIARQYDANPARFKGERRAYEIDDSHPFVVYEPGKCVACGICVRVAAEARGELGLTFVGRGFAVRTSAPLGETLASALHDAARACAEACPTGALVLREDNQIVP